MHSVRPRSPLALLLGLVLTALLSACAPTAETPDPAAADAQTNVVVPTKGAIDTRDYRYFTLPNGLRVVLVSDPTADKAAAAMAVHAGSFEDPANRLGLAHFLEHMLFLGTEKYPEPDAYGQYISQNGGSQNAYTSLDHTNFFFSISADKLHGGLDRFSQFFVAPLFTAQYVDREKNAVNSEYQLQLRNDGWRTYMTQKHAMNPAHPGSRFTIGSLDTLADRGDDPVRDDLLKFYRQHYSADQMALVILGREDLDTLASWATEMFSAVPRRPTDNAGPDVPLFREGDLPSLMRMQPVKERRVLEFTFGMPEMDTVYRVDPGDYLSNLLGHEGEGSLDAQLRKLGWIDNLSASASRFDRHNGVLSISIELTKSGLDHWQDIGRMLFEYVDDLRSNGVEAWRYQEQSRLSQLAFDYREKGDAFGYVRTLASNVFDYPPEDVIRGPYAMDRFDPKVIDRFLDRIRPERAQVTLIAPGLKTDQVEPWFHVNYAIEPLPKQTLALWQEAKPDTDTALHMPAANPFVPEDLTLLDRTDARPTPLVQKPGLHVWHMVDTSFAAPRAQLRIDLRTARAGASAEDAVYARLYSRLVMDALNAYAYPAQLAGLSFDLSPSGDALTLSLGGFDDKLDVLLARVAGTMRSLDVRDDRFAHYRTDLLRDLHNTRQDRPYQQTLAEMRRLLMSSDHPVDSLIAAADQADVAGLKAWMQQALDGPDIVALFSGNLDDAHARRLASVLEEDLGSSGNVQADVPPTLAKLSGEQAVQKQVPADNDNSAFAMYVQGADQSWAERARFGMLAQMLSTPYFATLRTEQQLGYVVAAGPWVRLNTPGVFFLVQSPVASAADVEKATWAFLDQYRTTLADMTQPEFEAARAGLLNLVLEADKSLSDRTGRLWSDLGNGLTSFDSRDQVAAAIRGLSLDEMRTFYDRFLAIAHARRAITWTAGRFPLPAGAPSGTPVADTDAFKADSPKFTVPSVTAVDGG